MTAVRRATSIARMRSVWAGLVAGGVLALAAPAMAQDGQLSDGGATNVTGCGAAVPPCPDPAPPSDATGIAPVAKITATWPRVLKVRTGATAKAAAAAGPGPAAGSAPSVVTPEGTIHDAVTNAIPGIYKSTAHPRPGQTVTLTGLGSTDVDATAGQALRYEWQILALPARAAAPISSTDAVVPVPTTSETTRILATLLVTDADGNQAASKIEVPVVANVAPQLAFGRQKQRSRCAMRNSGPNGANGTSNNRYYGTGVPVVDFKLLPAAAGPQISLAALQKIVADRQFTLHANGCDPDGEIVRYEFARVQWKYPDVDSGKPAVAEPGQFAPANPANPQQAFLQTTVPTADLHHFYTQTGDGKVNESLLDTEVTFAVRAYDDEGAFNEALMTVKVAPNCVKVPQTLGARLTVESVGGCVGEVEMIDKDGQATTDKSRRIGERIPINAAGIVRVNGIEFGAETTKIEGGRVGEIVRLNDGSGHIRFGKAAVSSRSKEGVSLDLPSRQSLRWTFKPNGQIVDGFVWKGGTLAGLSLVNAENPKLFSGAAKSFKATITTETPGEFTVVGDASQKDPKAFSAGATEPRSHAATAAEPATFAASEDGRARIASAEAAASGFDITVPTLNIGGVEISNARLKFDGDDSWDIAGTIRLGAPIPMPKNTKLVASASIRDGRLGHLDGNASFGNGILLGSTGIYMTSIRFTLDFGTGVATPCVPDVGQRFVSFQQARELLVLFGFGKGATREARIANLKQTFVPDYTYDYGVPSFQVCGAVGFRTFTVPVPFKGNVPLASGTVALGYADYTDRDSVFRILGSPIKVLGFPGHIKFEVYSDGYAALKSGLKADLGPVSARADVFFEAQIDDGKFNSGAHAEVCITIMDIGCAAGTVLVSSRGAGACFELDVLFFELSAGGTIEFKSGDIDGYLDGCTVKEVEEHIAGKGNVKVIVHKSDRGVPAPSVRKVPPKGSPARTAFARTAGLHDTRVEPGETVSFDVPRADREAKARAAQAGFDVPARTVGATFMVKGAGGLTSFDVIKPDETVLAQVDGQPKVGDRIFEPLVTAGVSPRDRFKIVKDLKHGVTNVVVAFPTPGRWQIRIKEGAPAASNVRIAVTGPKPKMGVPRGARPRREADGRFSLPLAFLDQRDGIVAHVYERGGTGIQKIGEVPVPAKGSVAKRLSFLPIGWKKEPRTVIAFFERYGYPVGWSKPIQFTAPPTPPAPPVRGVRATASGRTTKVRWDGIPGVRGYEILIRINDGRRLSYTAGPNRNSISVPIALDRHDALNVAVRALSRRGRPGRIGTDRIAARGPRPRPRLTAAQRRALARIAR